MKKILTAAAATCIFATMASASGPAEPQMEPEVIAVESADNSGGAVAIVAITAILLAFAAADG